jgi:hypothetical protein
MTDRRSFLRGSSVLLAHAALGSVVTAFAATPHKATFFNESEMRALRALVDVILPETDSPAASAAGTHFFIDLAVPACANAAASATFRGGLSDFRVATLCRPPNRPGGSPLAPKKTSGCPMTSRSSGF